MTKKMTYNAEDIFKDIPGDDKNVLMTIPPEISEKMGWKEGDTLHIQVLEDGGLSISKVTDGKR